MPLFDTHAHYYDEKFGSPEEQETLLCDVLKEVPRIINCGITPSTSEICLGWAKKHAGLFAACGLHPENISGSRAENTKMLDQISGMLDDPECVAVGEIGLDYYWTSDNREEQKSVFSSQLDMALEKKLPVVIHDREAHGDCLDIVSGFRGRGLKGVFHSFSGSPETARELIKLGFYISFSGVITFKNAVKPVEVLKILPEDRILAETDCPYLAPVPFRGKLNDSRLMRHSVAKIAEIRGTGFDEMVRITERNAVSLFEKCTVLNP
ncbi:MAG: TatD family hydrolase [Clostridia bacterium]|nr:TatD family hydrolase [Clostridia bacterium]